MTKFLKLHPGGKKVLLGVGGQECSEQFNQFHNAAAVIAKYGPKLYVGELEGGAASAAKKPAAAPAASAAAAPKAPSQAVVPRNNANLFGDQIPYGDAAWYQGSNSPYYNDSHRKVRNPRPCCWHFELFSSSVVPAARSLTLHALLSCVRVVPRCDP